MEDEDKLINIETKDGKTLQGEILFTFEANGDNFILYSVKDKVFSAKIDDNKKLSLIEEDEWPLVEKIFNEYMEDTGE
ncbi:DUF1292 domain-containing protein [Candidatus Mycoplasma mahonii]|uniref:DUF1292 domain-containing protein n=1 Tax=Candidatus Mycoplasma mahonii TaxID=3004105 RepID=UPI0026EFB701|nr:DUF1292 domain-containing protein [Candidatus Mycoplasma mahonii]WKX02313.1 DUF1292 domain-containing protein [Candidatus Mycoplasma mahonii]